MLKTEDKLIAALKKYILLDANKSYLEKQIFEGNRKLYDLTVLILHLNKTVDEENKYKKLMEDSNPNILPARGGGRL